MTAYPVTVIDADLPEGFDVEEALRTILGECQLSSAFVWASSAEGHDYWSQIDGQLREGAKLPKRAKRKLLAYCLEASKQRVWSNYSD